MGADFQALSSDAAFWRWLALVGIGTGNGTIRALAGILDRLRGALVRRLLAWVDPGTQAAGATILHPGKNPSLSGPRRCLTMTRRQELVLAALAPAKRRSHSPVQVQKLFFLLDRNIPQLVDGPLFAFTPYNYGPFDRAVYEELDRLAVQGVVQVIPEYTWKNYSLTPEGQAEGERVLAELPLKAQEYIAAANNFVRSLNFTQLVSSIYKAFPEMRVNSVFQE